MAIASIEPDLCDGCRICVDVCPMDVIVMDDEEKAVIKYGADCHVCYLCENDCPEGAVYVAPEMSGEPVLPY